MDKQELVKQTLDQIPQANANAKRIVGLVKKRRQGHRVPALGQRHCRKAAGNLYGQTGADRRRRHRPPR